MRHRLSIFGSVIFGVPLLTLAALMTAELFWFDSLHVISHSSLTSVSGLVERTQFTPRTKGPSVHDVWVGFWRPILRGARRNAAEWNHLQQSCGPQQQYCSDATYLALADSNLYLLGRPYELTMVY